MNREEAKSYIKDEVFKLCQEIYEENRGQCEFLSKDELKKSQDKIQELQIKVIDRIQDYDVFKYDTWKEPEKDNLNFDDYGL